MKDDTKEMILAFAMFISLGIFALFGFAAIIGIPTYAILEIIKAFKS